MIYRIATLSKPGPRKINEDDVGSWVIANGIAVAVADGLGGMGGGDRASKIATSMFADFAQSPDANFQNLQKLPNEIHKKIVLEQKRSPELAEMATTLSAGLFIGSTLFAIHVGDSRIAVARGRGIIRLTKDHSEAQRLLSAGKLSKAEFLDYPRKNILESALGIRGEVDSDFFQFEVMSGDKMFFTSDGVHNLIPLREMREIAEKSGTPDILISRVDQLILDRGPEDNYSMAAVYAE